MKDREIVFTVGKTTVYSVPVDIPGASAIKTAQNIAAEANSARTKDFNVDDTQGTLSITATGFSVTTERDGVTNEVNINALTGQVEISTSTTEIVDNEPFALNVSLTLTPSIPVPSDPFNLAAPSPEEVAIAIALALSAAAAYIGSKSPGTLTTSAAPATQNPAKTVGSLPTTKSAGTTPPVTKQPATTIQPVSGGGSVVVGSELTG